MATPPAHSESPSIVEPTLGWLAVVLALSLPLYRPWLTLATTSILVLWFFCGGIRQRIYLLRHHGLTIAVLFFLALNLSSLLWTDDPREGVRYLTKYRYLLLLPMIASAVRPVFRRFAVTAFSLAAGASVVLSSAVLVGLFRTRDAHPGNPSPTMAHLDYGLLLALAALLILVRVLYLEMTPVRRALWSALAALTLVGLAINIGRAGHLAFAGGLVVLTVHWARGRPPRLIAAVAVALIGALLTVWLALPSLRTRVDEARSELHAAVVEQRYGGNVGGRIAALKVAREVFREDPILGTGVGGNIPAFRRVIDTRLPELKASVYWYRHYHNQYTQIATELGVVGLLALAWIFWELIRAPGRRRETDAAALVLATVYLLGFLGEPFLHKQVTLIMFSLFAGLFSAEQLEAEYAQLDIETR